MEDNDFDNEIIFEDIDIDLANIPKYEPPFVRSSAKQRGLLERVSMKQGLHYSQLIRKCNQVLGRAIRDIGELSVGEADKMIKEIGEIRK